MKRINPYLFYLAVLAISFSLSITAYLYWNVRSDQDFTDSINTNMNTFTFCRLSGLVKSLPMTNIFTINILKTFIRDILTFSLEIFASFLAYYSYRRHVALGSIGQRQNSPGSCLKKNFKIETNLALMTMYMLFSSIIIHLLAFVTSININIRSIEDTDLTLTYYFNLASLSLFLILKNFANFFIFFIFNSNFRKAFSKKNSNENFSI